MRTFSFICCVLLFMAAFPAAADLQVDGTRVVVDGGKQTGTLRISNVGVAPVLVQSWIDDGDVEAKPEHLRVPLITTTPLFRLNPGVRRDVHLRAAEPGDLPTDRESLFWLNIRDVPAREATGRRAAVEQAVHWRMKVFYRPAGLPGKPEVAIDAVEWDVSQSKAGAMLLRARNPTAYFVSLRKVVLNGQSVPVAAVDAAVPPYGEWNQVLEGTHSVLSSRSSLEITWIDGEGRLHQWSGQLASGP